MYNTDALKKLAKAYGSLSPEMRDKTYKAGDTKVKQLRDSLGYGQKRKDIKNKVPAPTVNTEASRAKVETTQTNNTADAQAKWNGFTEERKKKTWAAANASGRKLLRGWGYSNGSAHDDVSIEQKDLESSNINNVTNVEGTNQMGGASVDWTHLQQGEKETPEEYALRTLKTQVGDVASAFSKFTGNLNTDVNSFKDGINLNQQILSGKLTSATELMNANRTAIDSYRELVQDKFDDNTKAQKERLDVLESTWLQKNNEIENLAKSYYADVNKALDAKSAGESAGMASNLSSKGLSESLVANAVGGVDKKYRDEFNSLKAQQLDSMSKLQKGYAEFMDSMNKQRSSLEDSEVSMLDRVFKRNKGYANGMTKLQTDYLDNVYKPLEDKATGMTDMYATEDETVAKKQAKLKSYRDADTDVRRKILADNLITAGTSLSKIDMNILERATSEPDMIKALGMVVSTAKAAAAKGYDTGIGNFINSKTKGGNTDPEKVAEDIVNEGGATEDGINLEGTLGEEPNPLDGVLATTKDKPTGRANYGETLFGGGVNNTSIQNTAIDNNPANESLDISNTKLTGGDVTELVKKYGILDGYKGGTIDSEKIPFMLDMIEATINDLNKGGLIRPDTKTELEKLYVLDKLLVERLSKNK